jgi:hypothetical protein
MGRGATPADYFSGKNRSNVDFITISDIFVIDFFMLP